MPSSQCTVLSNVTLLGERDGKPSWLAGYHLAWVGNTIVHVGAQPPSHLLMERDDVTVIDGNGAYVTPGLIDVHINGAFGCDFAQGSQSQINSALQQLKACGVTALLPTIITAPQESMMASLQRLEEVSRQSNTSGAQILGLHVEGPLLNPDYCGIHPKGAIPSKTLNHLSEEELGQLLKSLCSPSVRMVTLAPETVPVELVLPALVQRHIVPMAGHTGASSEVIANSTKLGLAGVTHLFNAMKPLHHRAPGVVAMALTHPQLISTIIADGHHVYPEALRAAIHSCGTKRLALVSDALHLAGTPDGAQAEFGGQTIIHKEGKACNADGTLAGGATLLDGCVRNVIGWGLADSASAFTMATATPATLINQPKRGRLAEGCVADVVLWHDDWTPAKVWANGG